MPLHPSENIPMQIRLQGRGHRRYDYTAWLVHADELEDAGQAQEGQFVRRKGILMKEVMELVLQHVKHDVSVKPRSKGKLPYGVRYRLCGGASIVILGLYWNDPKCKWLYVRGSRSHLLRSRIRENPPLNPKRPYLAYKALDVLSLPALETYLRELPDNPPA